jgi:predicted phosphodiesterase
MYDLLIAGDYHIEEKAIDEILKIHHEILTHAPAKKFIQLGDYYNTNRPTAKELEFGTYLAKDLLNFFEEVIILRGNHTASKNNSDTIDYLRYLGIQVEDTYEYDNMLFGHFFVDKSELSFGTHKYTVESLKSFRKVILGHQHKTQEIKPNIYHLGAIRRVDFGEACYDTPHLLAIKAGDTISLPLVSPTGIKICRSINDLKAISDTTVRIYYVIGSFEQFIREINIINNFKENYDDFKIKLDFEKPKATQKTEGKGFIDLFKDYLNKVDISLRKDIEDELYL